MTFNTDRMTRYAHVQESELHAIVTRIKKALGVVKECYRDLRRVHDSGIYQEEYKTWDNFCQKVIGCSGSTGLRRIEVHESDDNNGHDRTPKRLGESSADKEGSKLDELSNGQSLSTNHCSLITATPKPPAQPPPGAGDAWKAPKEETARGELMDALGNKVPKHLRDVFVGSSEKLTEAREQLRGARLIIRGLRHWNLHMRYFEMEKKLDELIEDCKNGMPYCLCDACGGTGKDKCRRCTGQGWLTKWKSEQPINEQT
jgi:hypothetical protein